MITISTPQYESVLKEITALFLDMTRNGMPVNVPTASNEFKIEGLLFLSSLKKAQEFIHAEGRKPQLLIEDVLSFQPTKIEFPKGSILFDQEFFCDTIRMTVADFFAQLNQQFPRPELSNASHPMISIVLDALDKVCLCEQAMTEKKRTTFSVENNEQIIVQTVSTAVVF